MRFLSYGHRATLVFQALPALASDPKANLEVYWNDMLVRLLRMEEKTRPADLTISTPIPAAAPFRERPHRGVERPLRRDRTVRHASRGQLPLPSPRVRDRPAGPFPPALRLLPLQPAPDLADTIVGIPDGEAGPGALRARHRPRPPAAVGHVPLPRRAGRASLGPPREQPDPARGRRCAELAPAPRSQAAAARRIAAPVAVRAGTRVPAG